MSGQIGPKDPAPAGIIIYYDNNTKLTLVGSAQGLHQKWKAADKKNITVVQVFQNGTYQTWREEKGDPGPAVHIYNYALPLAKTNYYWYNEQTTFYENSNQYPANTDEDDVGFGVTSSDEYFLAVYNIAIQPSLRPTGAGGLSPIDPGGLPP